MALKRLKSIFLFFVLFYAGCATYQSNVHEARELMRSGRFSMAANILAPHAETEGNDQLIYVFDYATALQLAGEHEKSAQYFQLADQLSDLQDYVSVLRQSGSLLFSQEMVQYKGESFERLLINVMNAINYLMMDDTEGANVETRKLNEKLSFYRRELEKEYQQNAFAVYMNALIWEANRNWDSAYIDFERAYELNPNIEYLQEDLVRSAINARRRESERKWREKFGVTGSPASWNHRQMGELVLIYQQGWGPRKSPSPESPRFPTLLPVLTQTVGAKLKVYPPSEEVGDEAEAGNEKETLYAERSQKVHSVQEVAIQTFKDDYAALMAKRIAGVVAKEVVAHQIAKENEALGMVAYLAMHLSDRADVRQWSTLPESFQVAKIRLPPGEYKVRTVGLNRMGNPSGEQSEYELVKIRAGRKHFLNWRSFR